MTGTELAILIVLLCVIAIEYIVIALLLFCKRGKSAKRDKSATVATTAQTGGKRKNPSLNAAVKAVAVLVCICFVCVALLAVCNELLYISDEERLNRSLSKLYTDETFEVDSSFNGTPNSQFAANSAYKGKVNKVYKGTNGDYIIEALGGGGYSDGSVTLYVVIGTNQEGMSFIKAWAVKENVNQSYIDKVPSNAGKTWYVGKDISGELELEMTGATVVLTSTAIQNAVNMAAYYARTALGLGKNPEADAKQAALDLLGEGYENATFTTVNISSATVDGTTKVADALSDETNKLSFLFKVANGDETLFAYAYGEEETLKVVVVKDGVVVCKSEGIEETDGFYVNILANRIHAFTFGSYQAYAIVTNEADGVYTVAGLKVGVTPRTYVLKVTIVADDDGKGKVEDIEVEVNGFVEGYPTEEAANVLATALKGARLDTIESLYTGNKVSGATQSANLIRAAVEAALAEFDAKASAN